MAARLVHSTYDSIDKWRKKVKMILLLWQIGDPGGSDQANSVCK
jgi:hypothetical protein